MVISIFQTYQDRMIILYSKEPHFSLNAMLPKFKVYRVVVDNNGIGGKYDDQYFDETTQYVLSKYIFFPFI